MGRTASPADAAFVRLPADPFRQSKQKACIFLTEDAGFHILTQGKWQLQHRWYRKISTASKTGAKSKAPVKKAAKSSAERSGDHHSLFLSVIVLNSIGHLSPKVKGKTVSGAKKRKVHKNSGETMRIIADFPHEFFQDRRWLIST